MRADVTALLTTLAALTIIIVGVVWLIQQAH